MRVSLGHIDDASPMSLGDEALVSSALRDLRAMMGALGEPEQIRISRWPRSFPQYRPGHRHHVDAIHDALKAHDPRVVVAGSAYGGIGIPATILQAREAAQRVRVALST